jgi:hypothetical protein
MTDASVVRLRIGRARHFCCAGQPAVLAHNERGTQVRPYLLQVPVLSAPAAFSPGDITMKYTLLKEFLADFVRTRKLGRHFRRLATLDSVTDATVSREVPPTLAQTLTRGASSDVPELLARLCSHAEGLTETEAHELREQHGLNEVEHEQPLPWWVHLWHCYKNPFNLLLTLLAFISWLTEDMKAATVIFSMVVLSHCCVSGRRRAPIRLPTR